MFSFSEKYQKLRDKKIDLMGNFIKPIFLALEQEIHFQTDPQIQKQIHDFLMELMKCKIAGPTINDKAKVLMYGPPQTPSYGSFHLLQPKIIFSNDTRNALETVAEPIWTNPNKTTSRAKSSARTVLENILLGRKTDDYDKWMEIENMFSNQIGIHEYQQSLQSLENALNNDINEFHNSIHGINELSNT